MPPKVEWSFLCPALIVDSTSSLAIILWSSLSKNPATATILYPFHKSIYLLLLNPSNLFDITTFRTTKKTWKLILLISTSLLMVCFLSSSSLKYNAQPLVLAHVHSRYSCTYCSCYQKLLEDCTHSPTTLNRYAKAKVNIPCTTKNKSTVAQRL